MNFKEIQNIMNDFKKSDLMYLELETKEFKLKLSKQKENNIVVENNKIDKTSKEEDKISIIETTTPKINGHEIKSPLVGTFYAAASPDAKPFVEKGDYIKKGDVLCIIEAMKIMNEIVSEVDGKVVDVLFNNGNAIGFDDVLFIVDQNDTK